MAENFPNLKKETDTQIQKAQKGPKQDEHNQIYTNTYYNKKRHKLKERILKAVREKFGFFFFFNKHSHKAVS